MAVQRITKGVEKVLDGQHAILGVDPGIAACGYCYLGHEEVVVGTIHTPPGMHFLNRVLHIHREVADAVGSVDVLCIERMDMRGGRHKGDGSSLLDLSYLSGYFAGRFCVSTMYPTPMQWKGTVPKDVHHRRLRAKHKWVPERISKDALDAIGLALYAKKELNASTK